MVKIKGFENYFFCQKTCEIYSLKDNSLKKLNPVKNRGKKIIYALYINGTRKLLSKFQIIKSCIKEIESLKMN